MRGHGALAHGVGRRSLLLHWGRLPSPPRAAGARRPFVASLSLVEQDLPPPPAPRDAAEAEARVLAWLRAHPGGAVVALSGGADSALLLSLAAEALGSTAVVAATSRSESLPAEELADARSQAAAAGVEHVVLAGSETEI